jgi:hypothetical protein
MAYYNEDGTVDYSRPDDRPTASDVFGQRQREAEAALSAGNLSGKALQEAQNALSYATSAVQKQAVFQASFTPEQWNEKLGVSFPAAGTDAGYEYSADNKQRRKRFHDGKGGFTYGPFEPNPDYKGTENTDTRDAFAIIKGIFNQYGLEELGPIIETLMKEGYGPEEATLALKTDPKYNAPYLKRFKGNETRRTAGLNVLSEAEYLSLEDDYTRTLKSYGLESYFGMDRTNKQSAMADVIGADISAIEFTDRVSTAVDRVKMADPATKNAFQQFYGIGEADLVKYFLDPKKALVNLKEKATAAEIGGAAIGQGLAATMTSAEDLARFGINRQQAQAGYADIGQDLPTAGSLGRIYSESGVTYNQADAESATFKGLASAKRKKEQLKQLEEGQFSGKSGTALGESALSTQYLRRSSSSGQF